MKTVIIGGVAGGASAAARLRRLDESAEIVLLERGEYVSFANCGLPYYIGGEIQSRDALTVQTPQGLNRRFRIDVRTKNEATAINREKKSVMVRNLETGEQYEERYDKLVLSPGASPIRPDIPGIGSEGVFTLRNIPDTLAIEAYIREKHPKRAVVVGGGYIGVEMAENLVRAGLKTTIVELADHLIAPLDFDTACEVHNYLTEKGVKLLLSNAVKALSPSGDGIKLTLSRGCAMADMVILSVGVRPDTQLAQDAGLALNPRGSIIVDAHMRTSDADIYAVGDAVEVTQFVTGQKTSIPLAGPANRQGRIAADNICGFESEYRGTQGSSVLKIFDMTVAATGINETAARELGYDYEKTYTYSPSHATYYPGAQNMAVKMLFEKKTGRILGAQFVGFSGVDKRCDVTAAAIRANMTAFDLAELELCYAPPFSSAKDPVNIAGFVMENVLTGKVKNFYWHDVASLQKRQDVILLDVRTSRERADAHIDGFIHIPLDELRERLGELERGKPVYVHCHSGLRSYIACRILAGNGFDCYNLSGGFRLYDAVMRGRRYAECADCTGKKYE